MCMKRHDYKEFMHFNFRFHGSPDSVDIDVCGVTGSASGPAGTGSCKPFSVVPTVRIVLFALRLLTNRLLHDRLPQLTMAWVAMITADVSALVALLVVVEMARRAFARVQRLTWIVWGLIAAGTGRGCVVEVGCVAAVEGDRFRYGDCKAAVHATAGFEDRAVE